MGGRPLFLGEDPRGGEGVVAVVVFLFSSPVRRVGHSPCRSLTGHASTSSSSELGLRSLAVSL